MMLVMWVYVFLIYLHFFFFFFQAEDGIRDKLVTGVQTCALPISLRVRLSPAPRAPDEAADPQGLGEGAGPLGLERPQRCESPGRAVADHRGRGPEPEAGGPAALGGKGGARPAAAGARGSGYSGPGRDPAVLVRAVPRGHGGWGP